MTNIVEDKLAALTQAYAKELPKKIASIHAEWNDVFATNDADKLQGLLRQIHTLIGTSGTYGYTQLSVIAQDLEKQLHKLKLGTPQPALFNKIQADMQELTQLALAKPDRSIEIQKSVAAEPMLCIHILDKPGSLESSQLRKLNQFNYQVVIHDEIDAFITSIQKQQADLLLVEISFAEKIPPEFIQQMQDAFVTIVYFGPEDGLIPRLKTVRNGGQAFFVASMDMSVLLKKIDTLFEAKQINQNRILIVEDSLALAKYYAMILNAESFQTEIVNDPRDFLRSFEEFQPDLILTDINMPYCNGIELAQIIHQQEDFIALPIIYLSSVSQEAQQRELLRSAGDDFLSKPVDPNYLISVIQNRLMRSRILRLRMMRDSLTGLYNHTMIHNQLKRELSIAARYHATLSISIVDIDHFKSVNDTYGHQAGDKILKAFSGFLQNNLRKTDSIGRYGGEEFLIILPNTDPQTAQQIMDHLRQKFSQMPIDYLNQKIYITFSGGIASYPRQSELAALVKASDTALYRAKESGRNRIVII